MLIFGHFFAFFKQLFVFLLFFKTRALLIASHPHLPFIFNNKVI